MSVDGKWKVTMNTPMGSRDVDLELKADGSELSGTWGGQQGTQSFSGGKVDGDNLEWAVMMSGAMGQMELKFKGKVEGDKMNGDVQFGSFGNGTFSGTRA
jgi:hypothetical protein